MINENGYENVNKYIPNSLSLQRACKNNGLGMMIPNSIDMKSTEFQYPFIVVRDNKYHLALFQKWSVPISNISMPYIVNILLRKVISILESSQTTSATNILVCGTTQTTQLDNKLISESTKTTLPANKSVTETIETTQLANKLVSETSETTQLDNKSVFETTQTTQLLTSETTQTTPKPNKSVHETTQTTPTTTTTQLYLNKPKTSTYHRVSQCCSNLRLLFCYFFLLCFSFDLTNGLKIVSVVVPHHQKSGESVQLECNYELEGDVLYSVKWYRGMNEFFRFVPAEKNQMQVFDVPGIIIDTALSDSRRVTLRSVSRDTSGKFQCEVSSDLPSFHTVSMASEMLVVDFSNSVPNITGGRTRYHVGDEVHVNCTSAKSRPAASLMWYINDHQARSEELVEYTPVQDSDGLETSRLGLKFVVGAKDFPNGVLKIRCTATVAAVYWNSAEEAVEGQLPQTSPALESKGVYTGGSSPNGFASIEFYVLILLHQISQILLMLSR